MRKLLIVFLSICTITTNAQVSYGNKYFGGTNMNINVSTENDSIFLTVILISDRQKMVDAPKLLLRLTDEKVISLDGLLLASSSKNEGAYMIGNVAVASSYYITEAKFPITREQMEQLSKGVRKLRLNTSPNFHERNWRRDRIGKILYAKYMESSSNSFKDGF